MGIFTLIISMLFYLSLVIIFILYIISFSFKKYNIADKFLFLLFIDGFITIMVLSWMVILMNGGFNVNFHIKGDYSWTFFVFVPFFVVVMVLDYFVRKRIEKKESIILLTARYLLPVIVVIAFALATVLLNFNFNYYSYIK